MEASKQRIIQELVPGKQITLAHIIANPDSSLHERLNSRDSQPTPAVPETPAIPAIRVSAIGIMTITPPETAIIIADIAIKSAGVGLVSLNMASGSLIVSGTVSEVEAAFSAILDYVDRELGFEVCRLTKT